MGEQCSDPHQTDELRMVEEVRPGEVILWAGHEAEVISVERGKPFVKARLRFHRVHVTCAFRGSERRWNYDSDERVTVVGRVDG